MQLGGPRDTRTPRVHVVHEARAAFASLRCCSAAAAAAAAAPPPLQLRQPAPGILALQTHADCYSGRSYPASFAHIPSLRNVNINCHSLPPSERFSHPTYPPRSVSSSDRTMRPDGRGHQQLRAMACETKTLSMLDGSARYSHQGSIVLASVTGPIEAAANKQGERAHIQVPPRALQQL
jgi:hypothetical protein